jgi:hypothetical protein
MLHEEQLPASPAEHEEPTLGTRFSFSEER